MTHIHFIINPIAGHGTSSLTREFFERFFVKTNHQLTVKHSEYKKHAIELTKNSILEGADIIVACGGDGTINEVASCLVGTKIPLGIVPVGSGNGLASHLGVPRNLRRSLAIIKNRHIVEIDAGSINGNYFFSNTGVGFDASIIKNYESSERHTLIGYLKACLSSFREAESYMDMEIRANDMEMRVNPFLIFVSNSNADQNSPQLDNLFEDLYKVQDLTQQNKIVSNIWSEWMKTDNPESQKIMDMIPYFFQTRNYDEAIEALSYVIEQEPNFSEAYNKRATFYFMMGDFENSMKDIESTLALEPRHFGALDGMSRILISYQQYEQAFQVYEEMMSLMPNDVTLHMKMDRLSKLMYDDA